MPSSTFSAVAPDYLTFGLVFEELGRQLTASPLFASALVGCELSWPLIARKIESFQLL